MEEQGKFGFKSRRQTKQEEIMKHDFPYVEIIPAEKKGSVTKFRLLNGAAELLEFNSDVNKVSYFQDNSENSEFYLANTSSLINPVESKVNADNSFNNKALHRRICEDWKLELIEVLTFAVIKAEVEGFEKFTSVQFVAIDIEEVTDTTKEIPTEPEFKPIDPEASLPEQEQEDAVIGM